MSRCPSRPSRSGFGDSQLSLLSSYECAPRRRTPRPAAAVAGRVRRRGGGGGAARVAGPRGGGDPGGAFRRVTHGALLKRVSHGIQRSLSDAFLLKRVELSRRVFHGVIVRSIRFDCGIGLGSVRSIRLRYSVRLRHRSDPKNTNLGFQELLLGSFGLKFTEMMYRWAVSRHAYDTKDPGDNSAWHPLCVTCGMSAVRARPPKLPPRARPFRVLQGVVLRVGTRVPDPRAPLQDLPVGLPRGVPSVRGGSRHQGAPRPLYLPAPVRF